MRFFASVAALALGVAALPASNIARDEPANILAPVQNTIEHGPVVDGAEPFVVAASAKRSVAVNAAEEGLAKRATLVVDIWQDSDRHGRHEGLFTDSESIAAACSQWSGTGNAKLMQPTSATTWAMDGMIRPLLFLCPAATDATSSETTTATTMMKVSMAL